MRASAAASAASRSEMRACRRRKGGRGGEVRVPRGGRGSSGLCKLQEFILFQFILAEQRARVSIYSCWAASTSAGGWGVALQQGGAAALLAGVTLLAQQL